MTEAERTGLDHVVLPRRRPGLAILERHRPPPADNVIDAELVAFATSGDTILDPWAGTGSAARRAVAQEMRAVAADPSPLRQHIEELYASRCAVCRRPVVVDHFIWPRDGDAPGRKVYRCSGCDASLGGAEERVAAVDDVDLAKLGIEKEGPAPGAPRISDLAAEDLPAAPIGLTQVEDPIEPESADERPLSEVGGPPPPTPVPV